MVSTACLLLFAASVVVVCGEFVPPPLNDTPPVPDVSSPEVEVIKRFFLPNPEDILVDPTKKYFITGARDGFVYRVDIETGFYDRMFGPQDFNPDNFPEVDLQKVRGLCDGKSPAIEPICGGPLGIKFQLDPVTKECKSIWIANAYFGIFEGSCEEPWTLEKRIGIEGGFVNNVQPLGNYLYYTVSHDTLQRDQLAYVVLDNMAPSGSLHRLDLSNNYESEELASDLYFANGLTVSSDESFIYVSETTAARIRRFDIESGVLESFLDDIPVLTDNILVQDGEILVPGYTRNATMEALMTDLTALDEFLAQGPSVVGPAFASMIAPDGNLLIYDEASGNLKQRIFQGKGGKFTSASSAHKLGEGYLVGSSFFPGATWFKVVSSEQQDGEETESEEDALSSAEQKFHMHHMVLATIGSVVLLLIA